MTNKDIDVGKLKSLLLIIIKTHMAKGNNKIGPLCSKFGSLPEGGRLARC